MTVSSSIGIGGLRNVESAVKHVSWKNRLSETVLARHIEDRLLRVVKVESKASSSGGREGTVTVAAIARTTTGKGTFHLHACPVLYQEERMSAPARGSAR